MADRVFRTATWYRVFSFFAMLALIVAGTVPLFLAVPLWQRAAGVFLIAFGVAGFIDILVSRIVLTDEDIQVISLLRTRAYSRSDFESAKVDGGAVCLKRRDGGWVILPGTGTNALSMRNTIHAWIKRDEN